MFSLPCQRYQKVSLCKCRKRFHENIPLLVLFQGNLYDIILITQKKEDDYMTQLDKVRTWVNDHKIDIAYISDPKSIEYLTGFASDPVERILGLFVFPNADPFLFAPAPLKPFATLVGNFQFMVT